jgi:hypothetical protein
VGQNDTAAYRKSEIDVFFKKLRSESPQMLKSQNLHVSVYLRLNIPLTALVAGLDTYDFYPRELVRIERSRVSI